MPLGRLRQSTSSVVITSIRQKIQSAKSTSPIAPSTNNIDIPPRAEIVARATHLAHENRPTFTHARPAPADDG